MVKRAWTGLTVLALAACAQIAGIGDPDSTTNGTDTKGGVNGDGGPTTSVSQPDRELEYSFKPDDMLDFGNVLCGQPASEKTITFTNKSSVVKNYSIDPPGDPFEIVDDHDGSLRPGDMATVTVKAKPHVAGSVSGSLIVRTDGSFAALQLKITSEGAKLDWSPASPDMGAVNRNAGGNVKVSLVNSGNVGTALSGFTLTSGDPDFIITPDNTAIGKTATVDFTVTLPAGDVRSLSATFTPKVTGVCGEVPTLLVKGQRVDSDITITNADFGKKNCNSNAGTKDVSVKNYASIARAWTIDQPTKFDVTTGLTGMVAAGTASVPAEGIITVRPKGNLPDPGNYDETMIVHISDSPGGGNPRTFNVPLHVDVRGAKLSFTPNTLTFAAPGGGKDSHSFALTNTGNEDISMGWALQRTQGGDVWSTGSTSFAGAGSSQNKSITFQPGGQPPFQAKLSIAITAFGPLCNNPGDVTLNGNYSN